MVGWAVHPYRMILIRNTETNIQKRQKVNTADLRDALCICLTQKYVTELLSFSGHLIVTPFLAVL